ncbi:MAG: glucosamine-6-phosphate deaminase [Trueperaceae bacterium]|nr:glucosamine-6-phosphate deaminase [Trueperaceae bacterium]
MEILIRPTTDLATDLAAGLVADRLRARPDLVLGCATGRTMENLYANLVERHRHDNLSFARCVTFNLDEYVGLGADDPRSYHAYMREHLFRHVDIDPAHTHLPDGTADNLAGEAKHYEGQIAAAGGIDLQLLGLGESGHIGFNEPLSSLMSRTRQKALTPTTRKQNAEFFGGPDRVPARALTMGVGTILEAREVLMVVLGSAKADILAKATEGPITAMISATALQLHPNCKVIVDEDAAVRLQGQDHYRWIFENEPEWEPYR